MSLWREPRQLAGGKSNRMDLRIGGWDKSTALDPLQPVANFCAQGRNCNPGETLRTGFKSPQCLLQERDCTGGVTGLQVVECRRHLYQCLQKALLRLVQCQPDTLPMLVSQIEFCAAVAGKTLRERSATPVKNHRISICDFPSDSYRVPEVLTIRVSVLVSFGVPSYITSVSRC